MLIKRRKHEGGGPNKYLENNPDHISDLLNICDVEIDVWHVGQEWFLGHDYPLYQYE